MLAVEINTGFQLDNLRAPSVRAALADVHIEPNGAPFLLPLNQLLGFIGIREWHKKGIDIPQLGDKVHVPFSVFSPLCGKCSGLIAQAPLNPCTQTAFGINAGSGVVAAILAKRGILEVTATGTNPKTTTCTTANLARLKLNKQVAIQAVDLFPEGRTGLIVCNPPWSSAKPTSVVETTLYDPDNAVLTAFLNGVWQHLNPQDEARLVISGLAEHLHLHDRDFLEQCFQTTSLSVANILETKSCHRETADGSDSLASAHNWETIRLYRSGAVR